MIDFRDPAEVFGFCLIVLGIVFAFFILILGFVKNKKKPISWQETANSEGEPTERELHGKIVKKECFTENYGTISPHMMMEFYLTIQTDDGEETEFKVDEEIYHSVEEGQTGNVLIVGKRFYGFCPDTPFDDKAQSPKTE